MIAGRRKTGYDQIRGEASKRCKILLSIPEGNFTRSTRSPSHASTAQARVVSSAYLKTLFGVRNAVELLEMESTQVNRDCIS